MLPPTFAPKPLALLLSLGLGWYTASAADTTPKDATKTVRLLTIGNSFSRNATHFLSELAKAGGNELIHQPIVVGGASLELHATKALAHERDRKDEMGLYSNGLSLKDMLRAERWEFVTIQQASIKSHDIGTYRPFAAHLNDYVRQHAPHAKLLLHQTWAYRRDDPRFMRPATKAGEPATHEAMYRGLAEAYRTIARELDTGLIPVGDAFYWADTDPQWGYRVDTKFDFEAAHSPALPDQAHSLHIGWRWQRSTEGAMRLSMDGHHANIAGEYLGACVWYETLFGENPVGSAFVPSTITPDYARFLQEAAHRAVMQAQASATSRKASAR